MVDVNKINDGVEETDTVKVIECPGFKGKLLNVEDCMTKCPRFLDRKRDEIKQGDKVVEVIDRVLCGYPQWRPVKQVCEVN